MTKRLLIVALLLAASGCAGAGDQTGSTTPPPGGEVRRVEGYPLDRSMASLVSQRGVDIIAVVSGVTLGEARDVGTLDPEDTTSGTAIVTPATAKVDQTLRASTSNESLDHVTLVFAGGSVDGETLVASNEIAPPLDRLGADRLLVAGRFVDVEDLGTVLEPWFVYRIDSAGRVTSLLATAGPDAAASFSLADLEKALERSSTSWVTS